MNRQLVRILGVTLLAAFLAACGQPPTSSEEAATPPDTAASSEMEHGDTEHAMGTADTPYDVQFIDGMIAHHQGAIAMAEEALEQAEHPELRAMAQDIIQVQQAEIEQLRSWREEWYPNVEDIDVTGMDMGDMEVAADDGRPFDQRFIESMIPHHQGAISMSQAALERAEQPEIRQLAENVIQVQQAEIEQMEEWNRRWFNE